MNSDISTTHRYVIQENVSGAWFDRKHTFDSYDGALLGLSDIGAVDDPAYRVALITTIVAPVDIDSSHDLCVCGHMRAEHGDGACLVTGALEDSPYRDLGMEYADECMAFERARP